MRYATVVLLLILLSGCAVNKKYVEINIEEGGCLYVQGSVDPQFLRENTDEAVNTDAKPNLEIPLLKK